ncbi:RNA polymerase sigma factor FliA [Methylobacter sp. Wu8]|uniref:RNA polymerase sigma factor FliA n=1 Tax=Methylobacter tundripaludum TaxID=173365 RepID=A0A2S6GR40_9GAMM|nr:RNA polymerase sigma factor FliA [Methylobacter tundripaludum]MCF7965432.1 RNA polymerase sigma factor FliA [Methylobacter tundripaludum]MCK9635901.1 RNA polymerase sigma factor FliA [Methylobacter tundripaludum]PPK67694.1 RNA polymerase sigma-28 (SigD/FliA/WhiG) subunit [Methylobacter tundripaludum]
MSGVAMYTAVQAGGTDERVMQHAPLVKRIAYHLLSRLPDSVQVDDLIQAGMLGLLEAIKNYDVSQGASFDTYAGIRIRGAMLDEVRRSDWTPRSVHKKSRMVSEAIRTIENSTGREARDADVAEHLGIAIDEYNRILQDSSSCRVFSVEELAQDGDHYLDEAVDHEEGLADALSREGFEQALANAIASLPERERLVISLYYDEELNLREIGEVLNISESRVSQISTQAVLRLRSRMSEWTSD